MNEREQVAVIGGEGDMGKLTVDLFKRIGFETVVSDTRNPSSPLPVDAINGGRVVFFSVPVEEIPKIIEATQGRIGPQHLVMDNATVKKTNRDYTKNT